MSIIARIKSLPHLSGYVMQCLIIATIILGCVIGDSQSSYADSLPPNVIHLPADKMINVGGASLPIPSAGPVSQTEKDVLTAHITTLPGFPPNAYSGCHARAHYLYNELSSLVDGKLFKVWLFAGNTYSPALSGAILYMTDDGSSTSWGYHVAAAFRDKNNQVWVIDTLISSDPMLLGTWLSSFTIDGAAIVTELPGELYLFNKSEVPALDEAFMSHNVLNGNFYEYVGDAATNHYAATDIAADAVSSELIRGKFLDCAWKQFASQALTLKKEIMKTPVPAACSGAKSLYENELKSWISRGL